MSLPNYVIESLEGLKDYTDIKVKTVKILPFGNSTFSSAGNRDIQFKLPRDAILVGNQSFMYFQAQPTSSDSNATAAFMNNIATVFDQYKVEIGSTEVVNEQEYGFWKAMEFAAKAGATDLTSATTSIMNVPDSSVSGAYTKFALPLASKWDNMNFFNKALPLYKMDQITLTYYLNNTISEFTSATTGVSAVDIKNVELELTLIDSPKLRAALDRDLVRTFDTQYHFYSLLTSGATQLSVNIPSSVQNLKGLAFVQRPSTVATTGNWRFGQAQQKYKYTYSYALNNLKTFSTVIDGVQYPIKQIDLNTTNTEIATNLQRFWGNPDGTLGYWFDSHTFDDTYSKGYLAINFAADPNGVSGQSLVSKSGNIIVQASLTAAANTDCDFFLRYSKFYVIKKDGSFSVTK